MSKLLQIDISWDEAFRPKLETRNLARLENGAQVEALSFSAPAFLVHQLSTMLRGYGLRTCKRVLSAILEPDANYESIGSSLKRARLELIGGSDSMLALYSPKLRLLSTGAEEASSALVGNYARHILSIRLQPFAELIPKALAYVLMEYVTSTYEAENFFGFRDNQLAPGAKEDMRQLAESLYSLWQGPINEMTEKAYLEHIPKLKWKLR